MSGGFFHHDSRSWFAIESEALNLHAGHQGSCAFAAGGDCTCGLWAPDPEPEGISIAGEWIREDSLAAQNLTIVVVGYDADDRPMYGVSALHGAAADLDPDDDLPF